MRDFPLVTKVLIAINLLVFIANQFGALPYTVSFPGIYSLGTVLAHFSHASLTHLASNAIGIFMISPLLERKLGTIHYVLFLLFLWGAQVAFLPHLLNAPTLGFSGMLMGMISYLAFRLWCLHQGNPLKMFGRDLLVILGINIVVPLLVPQISFIGHALGALLGLFIATIEQIIPRIRRR